MNPAYQELKFRMDADPEITGDPEHENPEVRQKIYKIAEDLRIEVQIAGYGGERFPLSKSRK